MFQILVCSNPTCDAIFFLFFSSSSSSFFHHNICNNEDLIQNHKKKIFQTYSIPHFSVSLKPANEDLANYGGMFLTS